jgi:hypothetical protein
MKSTKKWSSMAFRSGLAGSDQCCDKAEEPFYPGYGFSFRQRFILDVIRKRDSALFGQKLILMDQKWFDLFNDFISS